MQACVSRLTLGNALVAVVANAVAGAAFVHPLELVDSPIWVALFMRHVALITCCELGVSKSSDPFSRYPRLVHSPE